MIRPETFKKIMSLTPDFSPKFLRITGFLTAICLAASTRSDAFVVDGIRDTTLNEPYTQLAVQTIVPVANSNVLANLHSALTEANLRLFLGGRAFDGNAILIFIDSKPDGVPEDGSGPYIPNNLIQTGVEAATINNLGSSTSSGMRFEAGFRPDYAIRIGSIFNNESAAPVSRFDLQLGTSASIGDSGTAVRSGGFISSIRTVWQNLSGNPADATRGVEMSLNLPLMGVPIGTTPIKVMAMLVNDTSTTASNQTLAPLSPSSPGSRAPIGTPNSFSFAAEPETQTITLEVTYTGDDSDNDDIPDAAETNDGIFLSPTSTGSNPLNPDTDGDSFADKQEVDGTTTLGFVSNPNIPNYTNIWALEILAVPGPANEMQLAGTDLTGQFEWQRDLHVSTPSQLGSVRFKFSAGGSPEIKWGLGDTPGSVKRDGNDITGKATATGFYQIDFDQAALTFTFGRKLFPNVAAYLDAYGLVAGSDSDGDTIPNENEFSANTDPTRSDSDNDGINDNTDPDPLLAFRDITFRVNMSFQISLGVFNPAMDSVKVQFFDGVAAPGELTLTDIGGGIHSETLSSVEGVAGLSFGGYKFVIVRPAPAPVVFENLSSNRSFNLGPAHAPHLLGEVYFNNFEGSGSLVYQDWALQFEEDPGSPGQDFDDDTFTNQEEFLFGTHPGVRDASLIQMIREETQLVVRWIQRESDVSYDLEQSSELTPGSWEFPGVDSVFAVDQSGVAEGYMRYEAAIPIDSERKFIRIKALED